MSQNNPAGQFSLLGQRRFLPLFLTQFFGAFNDNVFKNALIVLLVFSLGKDTEQINFLTNMAAGLFILPFFLFSSTAGQLADKYDKAKLMRWVKTAEIFIMMAAAASIYTANTTAMLAVLFLLGLQSAFFGPAKYAILPQALSEQELIGGNAQIEMGTFVAILLGTICGGLLIGVENANLWITLVVITVAVLGWLSSLAIPSTPSAAPDLKINWNIFSQTFKSIGMAKQNPAVFLSIIGISWFWLIGAAYLTQLPAFTRSVLGADNTVVTLLLCMFTIGVATGSLLCERMSGNKLEIGLVPFGALGLSLLGADLFWSSSHFQALQNAGISEYMAAAGSYRILIDLFAFGVFGGFYIVPLYALIQMRSKESERAQIISVNNILNALFMVISAGMSAALLNMAELSIPQLFLVIAIMNIFVCLFIFQQLPEFSMRFLVWLLSHTLYRVKHSGLDNIPDEGGAMIVCNHVSFMDALLLAGAVRRPVRFIMFKPIYDLPVLNFIFRTGRTIPIISQHVDKAAYEHAFEQISEGLAAGDLLCIFPEGKLTETGEINEFKTGVERIIERNPVPVIPMALKGLWGSFFSHKSGQALTTWPQRFWSRVEVAAAAAIPAEQAKAQYLQQKVSELRGSAA